MQLCVCCPRKRNTLPRLKIFISDNQVRANLCKQCYYPSVNSLTTAWEFCQNTQFVQAVNIPGHFQEDEMKSLKLKMKVGVIQASCDNGWGFFPCSLQYFLVLLGCSLGFLVIFITSSIFILQLPHDSSFCQLHLLSVLFPKFSSHFPSLLFQLQIF